MLPAVLCLSSARGARLSPNALFSAGGVLDIFCMHGTSWDRSITFEFFLLASTILGHVRWGLGLLKVLKRGVKIFSTLL